MVELFCENTSRPTIFEIEASSKMFDWVIYRPPKNWNFQIEGKVEQIITIVRTHIIFLLNLTWQKSYSIKLLLGPPNF